MQDITKNHFALPQFKNIISFACLLMILTTGQAQQCSTDSNFYSITFHGPKQNFITGAKLSPQNEVVTLCQNTVFSNFVAKFTAQGNVIWSNEYEPNYPHTTWYQYPWYNNTQFEGICAAKDSTYYIFGSSNEHGKSINNVETPPQHLIGLLIHIDKYGSVLSCRYVGNWFTDYSVHQVFELANGNIILYARSHFFPYASKVLCASSSGTMLWATPLQPIVPYGEVDGVNPFIKELEDGSIVIANEMTRYIDDTLRQPFIPDIILPAPLYYFHIFKIDPSGKFLWQYSYQCPPTKNTSVKGDFVPQIKNVTKLPNGNFSICADMYIPTDNEVYYYHTIFSKRAVNLIVSDHGFFLKLISYSIQGKGACSLENAVETGNNSEQLLLAKDSTNEQSILFKIDSEGKIVWSKAYANPVNGSNAASTFLEKQNNKGYFIFHSDPASLDFHLSVTNAVGNDPCTQLPATMVSEEIAWPWFVNKIHYDKVDLIVDYGYSPFSIAKKVHPLSQTINCQYQYECCKDFIDSLRPHNINLCEGQFYTLPDKTIVKDSGTYYVTLKTQAGCDSIIFYNVKILKLPAHLTTSQDTCLNNEASILLTAAEGYESYLWNNVSTTVNPFYPVSFPGSYTVKVQNICGSKTDTIQVYDQCDFPIYFPGAFTPNGDLLNDILRVPALNKNRLIRLSIYNRWGKLIYHTTNPEAGWDGNLAGIPQQGGTYIYFLEMVNLSGKKVSQRGTVVLIR